MNAATQRRNQRVAHHLRRLRNAAGLTQEDLALNSGFNRERVVHWENEDYGISPKNLERLAQTLGVDASEFYAPIPVSAQ
jgi:transcriptional regulator with XRE-family HTH domain